MKRGGGKTVKIGTVSAQGVAGQSGAVLDRTQNVANPSWPES